MLTGFSVLKKLAKTMLMRKASDFIASKCEQKKYLKNLTVLRLFWVSGEMAG